MLVSAFVLCVPNGTIKLLLASDEADIILSELHSNIDIHS